MIYAGIGSRHTPANVCLRIQSWAMVLGQYDHILRSGHARGADQAAELGCDKVKGKKEIFLPQDAYGKLEWFDHAAKFHPAWQSCDARAMENHARNSAIMLGENLNVPVDFVLCWTYGGAVRGGTGQALRIAEAYRIPVFNLWNGSDELTKWLIERTR